MRVQGTSARSCSMIRSVRASSAIAVQDSTRAGSSRCRGTGRNCRFSDECRLQKLRAWGSASAGTAISQAELPGRQPGRCDSDQKGSKATSPANSCADTLTVEVSCGQFCNFSSSVRDDAVWAGRLFVKHMLSNLVSPGTGFDPLRPAIQRSEPIGNRVTPGAARNLRD